MNLQFFVFLGLFYTVSSLQCETGADLSAGFFSSLAMSTQECMNPESSCIRIDLEIVLFGFQQGEVSLGRCINTSLCISSCNELIDRILQSDSSLPPFAELSRTDVDIRSCERICCDWDNCNNKSVSDIQQEASVRTTSPPQTTTFFSSVQPEASPTAPEMTDLSYLEELSGSEYETSNEMSCEVGISLRGGQLLDYGVFTAQTCSFSERADCVRTEATFNVFGLFNVSAVANDCGNSSICNDDHCRDLLLMKIKSTGVENLPFDVEQATLLACRKTCCDWENCNESPIDQLVSTNQNEASSLNVQSTVASNLSTDITSLSTTTLEGVTTTQPMLPILCEEKSKLLDLYGFYNNSDFITVNCRPGSVCFLTEARFTTYQFLEMNATIGFCALPENCNQPCETTIVNAFYPEFLLGDFIVESCQTVCCNYNNCNANTINEINQMREDNINSSPEQTTQVSPNPNRISSSETITPRSTEAPPSQCLVGTEIEFFQLFELNPVECPTRVCLRLEAEISVFSAFMETLVIGLCANSTACNSDCLQLIDELFEDADAEVRSSISIESCNQICCTSSVCNSASISELEASETTTTTVENIFTTISAEPDLNNIAPTNETETTAPTISKAITIGSATTTKLFSTLKLTSTASSASIPSTTAAKSTTQTTTETSVTTFSNTTPSLFSTTTSASTLSTTTGSLTRSPLRCRVGNEIRSQVFNTMQWNEVECPPGSSNCIRIETELLAFGTISVDGLFGACANTSVCEENCDNIVERLREQSRSNFSPGLRLSISTCNKICCTFNTCNSYTVEEIRRIETATTTSLIPTLGRTQPASFEPTTSSSFLQCQDGTTAFDSLGQVNVDSWNTTRCVGETHNKCLRLETNSTLFGVVNLHAAIGFCANSSTCGRDCESLARELAASSLPTTNVVVDVCQLICCDWNGCNENNIVDIRRLEAERTTVQTTTSTQETTTIIPLWPISLVSLFGLGSAALLLKYRNK